MKRWWNPKTCLLLGIGLLTLLILGDYLRSVLITPAGSAAAGGDPKYRPAFRVGDVAPDFSLPDRGGKVHHLQDLVRRDTLLCFTCGCANCLDLQTYLGILIKRMGEAAPDVISVSTMPRDREETYFRDTRLKQKILYEPKEGPVMDLYKGHPCPRVYRLKGDRTVAWIGTSPGDVPYVQVIGSELAENLGFPPEGPIGPGEAGAPGATETLAPTGSLPEKHEATGRSSVRASR